MSMSHGSATASAVAHVSRGGRCRRGHLEEVNWYIIKQNDISFLCPRDVVWTLGSAFVTFDTHALRGLNRCRDEIERSDSFDLH